MAPDPGAGTHGADNGMEAYLLLEAAFCDCEAGCECGWDEEAPDARQG